MTSNTGLRRKAWRSSALTVLQSQGENLFRLVSNLVLTRLLVPEAFGLMAIVQVFIAGLIMFSDLGIRGSIVQNRRGDEPDFLNTAWTMQIIRGFLLWIGACLLSFPAAAIYDEPLLLQLLPVAGLTLIVTGFQTTNSYSAIRNLELGRVTVVELTAQVLGLVLIGILAWALRSVWALAIGTVLAASLKVLLMHIFLTGIRNRFRLDRGSVSEIFRFGKYIFFTSLAAFLIRQSDRAILGAFLPLETFGVYNIGWVLASVPSLVAVALGEKVMFPLYRLRHPLDDIGNRRKIFAARRVVVAVLLLVSLFFAVFGIPAVEVLYDDRYILAGPIVVLMASALVPQIVTQGAIRAAVAKGDSRSFFIMMTSTSLLQVVLVYFGARELGIFGAILGVGAATILTYPLLALILRRYKSWDMWGDLTLFSLGAAAHFGACWWYREEILQLLP
ncbi:MAG: polysaccharide biosynthesis protein [Rhodobacteraceae bacterium]|nr:polysaccharide biosynthesis protein [Paracoccaceae bacterium]